MLLGAIVVQTDICHYLRAYELTDICKGPRLKIAYLAITCPVAGQLGHVHVGVGWGRAGEPCKNNHICYSLSRDPCLEHIRYILYKPIGPGSDKEHSVCTVISLSSPYYFGACIGVVSLARHQ